MEFDALGRLSDRTIEMGLMRFWPLAVVFAAAIAPAGHADAAQGVVPPPPAKCKPCEPPVRRLQQLNASRDALRERIARADETMGILQSEIEQDKGYINSTCTTADPPPDPFLSIGQTPLEQPTEAPATPGPEPRCEPCIPPAEELQTLEVERQAVSRHIHELDADIRALEREIELERRYIVATRSSGRDARYGDDIVRQAEIRLARNIKLLEAKRA